MTAITGLYYDPVAGIIHRRGGLAAAYVARSAHEQDPTLGHEMAAAPEMVETLTRAREFIVIACGDKAPYVKVALSHIDATLAKTRGE